LTELLHQGLIVLPARQEARQGIQRDQKGQHQGFDENRKRQPSQVRLHAIPQQPAGQKKAEAQKDVDQGVTDEATRHQT